MYVQLKCQDPNYCGLGRCINYAVISKTHFSIVRVSRSPQLYGQNSPIKQQSQTDGLVMVVNQVPYVMQATHFLHDVCIKKIDAALYWKPH